MKKNKTMIICFTLPAIIVFLVMFLYPVIRTTMMSFFSMTSVSDPMSTWEFVGFGNYSELMKTSIFMTSMKNMLKIWFIGGIGVIFFALLFSVILTNGVRAKSFWRALIYLPNIISAVAFANMWIYYIFQKRFGMLHNIFAALGLDKLARTDYMNGDMKFWSLLIAFCFGSVGYFMLIFLSGIERLPQDYYEAATIDGANKVQQFFRITLPLLKGVFKTVLTFWTVSVVGFFVWSQMWSPNNSESQTITPVVYMYNIVFGNTGMSERMPGKGAAVGILMALVVLIIFFLVNRLFREDDLEF
ncbi:MAG: sugar ABC transporter permease [Eubacteriales bacterium]|nr:sugar ABC transporter permease [Eubacteriales bacterium]